MTVPSGGERRSVAPCKLLLETNNLLLVDESTNQRRRTWRARARQSQCRNGHDLTLHAMVTPEGGRLCRICQGPA